MKILRSPLLHFLLGGLLIFVFAEWRAALRTDAEHTIIVDEGRVQYLRNLYSVQFGYYPDAATLESMIESHIRDEVLFREAVKLSLAQDDEIIRRRMVQKLEYLLLDSETQAAADEDTLLQWYEMHGDQYRHPASASFRHIYFRTDGSQSATAEERALTLLAQAQAGGEEADPSLGDRFALQYYYADQSPANVRQLFGQGEFSEAVFTAPVGEWSGPHASGYGLHLVRVEAREASFLPPFAEVRDEVERHWRADSRDRHYREKLDELMARYTVVRPQ